MSDRLGPLRLEKAARVFEARPLVFLVLLAALSVAVKLPLIAGRHQPTIFGDEMLYTYKARNFAYFGSYYAPAGTPDCLNLTDPLYSVLIAPFFLRGWDLDRTIYPMILLLNAVLHASMIFPAFKIAQRQFPAVKWHIAIAIGFWTIPAAYSAAVMSEALFIPLFLWCAFFYQRFREQPTRRWLELGLVITLLVLTRPSGVAMFGVLFLILCLSRADSRFGIRIASLEEVRSRWLLLVAPASVWIAWRAIQSTHQERLAYSATRQMLDTADLLTSSPEGLLSLLRAILGQLTYLNLASFTLLLLLTVALFKPRPTGPRIGTKSTKESTLLKTSQFVFFSCLALFSTSVVFMVQASASDKPRWTMNGRYVDMIVPIIVVYGLGSLPLFPPRRKWVEAASLAVAAILAFVFYANVPLLFETRAINAGGAWCDRLLRVHELERATLAVLGFALVAISWLLRQRRSVRALVLTLLISLNLYNTWLVFGVHDRYARRFERTMEALKNAADRTEHAGGTVFYAEPNSLLTYRVLYYFHQRAQQLTDGSRLDPERDRIIDGEEVLSVPEFENRLADDLALEGEALEKSQRQPK